MEPKEDPSARSEALKADPGRTMLEASTLAAMVAEARRDPRNEDASYDRLMRAVSRPKFAEKCRYLFPRGDAEVKGPSVNLAREAAKCWQHVAFGLDVVTLDANTVKVRGWAHDLERNVRAWMEDSFRPLVQRKVGKGRERKTIWKQPDERDLRELINRRGAICVRNALLQVLPEWLIDEALEEAEEVIARKIGESRDERLRKLVLSFSEVGVSVQMLEAKLGHPLKDATTDEVKDLIGIGRSIEDGHTKVSEHFASPASKEAEPEQGANEQPAEEDASEGSDLDRIV